VLRRDSRDEKLHFDVDFQDKTVAYPDDAVPIATSAPEAQLSKYLLKLYVTGSSPRTSTAIANLKRICAEELEGRYELEIIDVLEAPQLAEDMKILATPTLIKQLPPPLRRVIGDLSDKDKVLLGLEVRPGPIGETPDSDAK
jgi:circadian clock protein KaiB